MSLSIDEMDGHTALREKNNVDPMKFHSYYISNGFMVGRNKMKDWKGAVRHWESNTLLKTIQEENN